MGLTPPLSPYDDDNSDGLMEVATPAVRSERLQDDKKGYLWSSSSSSSLKKGFRGVHWAHFLVMIDTRRQKFKSGLFCFFHFCPRGQCPLQLKEMTKGGDSRTSNSSSRFKWKFDSFILDLARMHILGEKRRWKEMSTTSDSRERAPHQWNASLHKN